MKYFVAIKRRSLLSVVTIFAGLILTNDVPAQKPQRPPLLDLDGIQFEIFLNGDNYKGWDAEKTAAHAITLGSGVGFPTDIFKVQYSSYRLSGMYRMSISFTPLNRKTAQPMYTRELKIGVSYYRHLFNAVGYSSDQPLTNDTVVSTNYFYAMETDEVSIDGAFHIKTNPENGVAAFTGLGGGIGHALRSSVGSSYFYVINLQRFDTTCQCSSYVVDEKNFTSKAKSPFYFNGYLPFGFEFRVIRKWIVSVEGNAGLSWQVFTGAPNSLRFQYSAGIGLKYFW